MNRGALVNFLLGITIALLPLFRRISFIDIDRMSKDNLLLAIMAICAAVLPAVKRKLPEVAWIFFTYASIMVLLNQHEPASMNVFYQGIFIVVGLVFFASYYEKHDSKTLYFILNGMAGGCIIQALLAVSGYLDTGLYEGAIRLVAGDVKAPHYDRVAKGVIGSLGNSNLMGAYLGITSLALFRKRWIYALPLAIWAIWATHSLMANFTFLAGVAYYINAKHIKFSGYIPYVAVLALFIGFFLWGLDGLDSGRFMIWNHNLSLVDYNHFLNGMGAGWYPDQKFTFQKARLLQEHNEYLSFFNIFGVIGLGFLGFLLKKSIPSQPKEFIFPAILFACFFNSFGHFTIHQSTTAIIFLIAAGVCMAQSIGVEHDLER